MFLKINFNLSIWGITTRNEYLIKYIILIIHNLVDF